MKHLVFTLCIFFILINAVASAEIYKCVGSDGKIFFTDNPPQNAQCKNSSGEDADTSQQQHPGDKDQQTNQSNDAKGQTDQAKKLMKIPRWGY
ncbi:MAG: hypothetical protein APR62_03015 [Smithella sp. SDB]|nr:MAG: hypothetical protein APR62_03015 [Smithella sp. SDB]